jgi:hypothetical protein
LLDFHIRVNNPGDRVTVTVYFLETLSSDAEWFKFNTRDGWSDFSDFTSFNTDRNEVRITLVDGAHGDEDGIRDAIIKDPSGLGITASEASISTAGGGGGGGGGGGCFIGTSACNLDWQELGWSLAPRRKLW